MSYKDSYIDQEAMENKNRFDSYLDEHGRLDMGALHEGARHYEETREKEQQALRARQQFLQDENDKELTDLMSKLSERVSQDQEAKVEREIAEAKAISEQEIEAAIYKKNGMKAENEIEIEKSLKSLIGGLNLNEMD